MKPYYERSESSDEYQLLDADVVGKFTWINDNCHDYSKGNVLVPAFSIQRVPETLVNYIPGYMDHNTNFFPGPISTKYVLIKKLIFKYDYLNVYLNLQIVVYSKDYETSKEFDINHKYSAFNNNYPDPPFNKIFPLINCLNKYIFAGNDIDLLTNISLRVDISGLYYNYILSAINNLSLSFSDNHIYRKGETYSWREVAVTNLPKSTYIRSIFEYLFSNGFSRCFKISAELLIIQDNREGEHSDEKIEIDLKDRLKIFFGSYFNEELYEFEMLIGENHYTFPVKMWKTFAPTLQEAGFRNSITGPIL